MQEYLSGKSNSRAITILLVEDNTINQKFFISLSRFKQWNLYVTDNGHEALTTFRTHNFDLILMDIMLPDMNGYEIASIMRDMEKKSGIKVPIIAVTAGGNKQKCIQAGMDACVLKPIDIKYFFDTIERLCPKSK